MFQKKALISALIAGAAIVGFSATASADLPGFYAGGDLGWSNIHQNDNPFSSGNGTSGLGAGAQFGYQFNDYLAAEVGYMYFHSPSATVNAYGFVPVNLTYKEQAADLVAKAILPISNCFDIYAKGGAAYVDAKAEASSFGYSQSQTTTPIRPVYGIGVSYNITPNVSADVSWTRVQNNDQIPNADLAAVGLTYHFG